MRLVLATHDFASLGGSETYLLTLAQQLQRLGHDVSVHTANAGEIADVARERGVAVSDRESQLPAAWDAALVQDAGMAFALAAHRPGAPIVLRASSEISDFQLPPGLPGVVAAVVALSDRVAERVSATAAAPRVVRLRQAIDTDRFAPRGRPRERPRVAVALGNHLRGERLELLRAAWEPEGVELRVIGRHGLAVADPETAIADADIVVAKGRALLEGMACGRAAYVYDFAGTDGWMTPASYPALEAEGFGGRATGRVPDAAALRADLAAYDPAMGLANRDLVVAHHSARRHAEAIATLLAELAGEPPPPPPDAPLRELARLVRLQQATEGRAYAALLDAQVARDERDAARREVERLRAEAAAAGSAARDAQAAAAAALEIAARAEAFAATRRYRLGAALGSVADALRRDGRP
jgi:hypothetical protein